MNPIIENNKKAIEKLCKDNKVNQLFVFGSVLNDKFNEKSDIDLIVDIKNDDPFEYTDSYFNLLYGFENLFHKKIDLLEQKALKNPYFIRNVDKNKILIYG